ncbi:hypothetical protein GF402_00705 [Candidatus Fermentibacteria bacterium]|nr:hypothetical protein [Candidatus Fermentibacteria bacterium]
MSWQLVAVLAVAAAAALYAAIYVARAVRKGSMCEHCPFAGRCPRAMEPDREDREED